MNRTLFLILLLLVSVVGLLALSLNTQTSPKVSAPAPVAKTTLYLGKPVTASGSAITTVDVNINTQNNKVTGVQLEMSYNKDDLGNVDVVPGPFIPNPVSLFKKIDPANGRLSYALAVPLGGKGVTGTGVVATLSFNKLKTAGQTEIKFLPKSLVSAEGIVQSVLRLATGIKFDLGNPTPAPSAK